MIKPIVTIEFSRPILQTKAVNNDSVLPGVHLVASLVKHVIIGAPQGRFGP
jgi:hypothetical protein